MTTGVATDRETTATDANPVAARMAAAVCRGFRAHDDGKREAAVEAFATVDTLQFAHLSEAESHEAAEAYVDALFRKNDVELAALRDGEMDRSAVAAADWSPVAAKFRERAAIVGMDPTYATASTEGWKQHKAGGDYWTPLQRAQMYELRAAMDDPTYPGKDRYGRSGFGPEPVRYVLGVELHDMHTEDHWAEAKRAMTPYYERILEAHDE